jgi:hypothetical protein
VGRRSRGRVRTARVRRARPEVPRRVLRGPGR